MNTKEIYICVKAHDIFKVGDKAELQKRMQSKFLYNSVIIYRCRDNAKRVLKELDFDEHFRTQQQLRQQKIAVLI